MTITRSTKRELEDALGIWAGIGYDETILDLLRISLEIMVPLYVEHLHDYSREYLREIAQESRLRLATNGPEDLIHTGLAGAGSNRSETLDALARMVAICSMVPGGINCFGMHFETPPYSNPEQAVAA